MTLNTRSQWPRVTFGIIVLNGEPFTRYCLRSLYPFAHQIVVVEGGHEDTRAVATSDGHSIDGTLEALRRFKAQEDPLDKVEIVTRDGFWPKTDELGRHRTAQSRAYAERATGDYLWQVDIDEFYRPEDMAAVLSMLGTNPQVTAVSFRTRTFWGRPQYVADCWDLRRGARDYHRLFKWGAAYRYVTHEPPTVIDNMGRDLRRLNWIRADETAKRGVYLFHYSLLFPWQVEQKVRIYKDEKPDVMGDIVDWATHGYFALERPYRVHNLYRSPSWLDRYEGEHPPEVVEMMNDVLAGRTSVVARGTEDVERLLGRWWYSVGRTGLIVGDHLGRHIMRAKQAARRTRRHGGVSAVLPSRH
ncbi:MAG: glycosyltransferase family 2 protein [Thermoleophilia bacterium]|nr:glycosyltransferase family 2 protein [Thermoleophilia bacterium]